MNDQRPPDDSGEGRPDSDKGRVWWHSRRGLRELDLLLLPFVEDAWAGLDDAQKAVYVRLLDNEDTELLVWFTGRAMPLDPEFASMIDLIRSHQRPVA